MIRLTHLAKYRFLIPKSLRVFIRKYVLTKKIYSHDFFGLLDEYQHASYPIMAQTIVNYFHPRSVIDVGCGSGGLLLELKKRGVYDVAGLEFSRVGIKRCRTSGLNVKHCDLSKSCRIDNKKSICICLEVAEHLAPRFADQFVRNLSSGPNLLVFSAATPGQGGYGHLNEQPHDYWVEKFRRVGFALDINVTEAIRREWSKENVATWFSANVMIFHRASEG